MLRRTIRYGSVIAVMLLLVASIAPPAAAGTDPEPSFVVDLDDDGSARAIATFTYDPTDDAEREAFRSIATDSDTREDARARFLNRLRTVAAEAADVTGREMLVRDAAIDVSTIADGETGVISLSAAWIGLATREDGRLVITEPFASGFTTDRRFVVHAPDGYAVTEATPAPADGNGANVAWTPGMDLDGFRVVIAPAETVTTSAREGRTEEPETGTTRSGGQPGFGVGITLATLFATAIAAHRGEL